LAVAPPPEDEPEDDTNDIFDPPADEVSPVDDNPSEPIEPEEESDPFEEPEDTDSDGFEPIEEPTVTEPAVTETDDTGTDDTGTDDTGTDDTGTDDTGTDDTGTDDTGTDDTGTDDTGTDDTGTDDTGTDSQGSDKKETYDSNAKNNDGESSKSKGFFSKSKGFFSKKTPKKSRYDKSSAVAKVKRSAASYDPKYKIEKVSFQWKEKVDDVINELESQTEQEIQIGTVTMGSTIVVAGVFSAGYITWMLQSGALFASMLSSFPTWLSFDPLPILESSAGLVNGKKNIHGSETEDDQLEDKIQSLMD
jgi:hypothetical protein